MEKTSRVKKIVPAPLFNRTFGAIIDLVLTIFIGAGIFLGISSIASNVSWIKAYKDDYNQTVIDSGLMKMEEGELKQYEYESYDLYEQRFYNFYHDYFSQKTEKIYDIYWFNVFIYGQTDILGKYTETDLNDRSSLAKNIGPTYFTYRLDDSNNPLVNEFAIPKDSHNGVDELSDATKTKLRLYFYASDEEAKENEIANKYKFVYYYALSDLTSLSKLQDDYNHYAFFSTTLPLVIAIFVTFMIFYFLVPLCFKNGETLGKKVMHICLVNRLGYAYRRVQLIPRFLFPTFLIIAVVFITGFSFWSLGIISISLLISYLFVIFTKENKALHDYFAGTLVIDAKESTWFKNIDEEEKMQKDVDSFVEEIKSREDALTEDNIIYTNPHFKDKK